MRQSWRRVSLRWLSLCGIVVPPLDVLINVVVAVQQPGHDFLRDYISDLAARGRPFSGVLCVWWGLFPLQFGPFAVAVFAGLRGHRLGELLAVLLAFFAACIGLCGVFRYDPVSPEATPSSRAHIVASTLAGAALFPGPVLLWLATRHDPRWRWVRKFSLAMQAAGAAAALPLALAYFNAKMMPWRGLAERSFWGVYYIWIFRLAVHLRRDAPDAVPPMP